MKKLVALLMLVIMGISSICMACADTAIEVNTNLKVKKTGFHCQQSSHRRRRSVYRAARE